MTSWSIVPIAVVLAGCGPGPVAMTGSGTILYWHTEMAPLGQCGGAGLVAALTPDAAKVEVLRYMPPAIQVERLLPPDASCQPGPVQMVAADIDGDGRLDIAVSDASCGNWYALQEDNCQFATHSWSESFPPSGPMPWMSSWVDSMSSRRRILLASDAGIAVMDRPTTAVPWQFVSPAPTLSETDIGQTEVSDVAVFLTDPLSGKDAVLFQEGGSATLITMDSSASVGTTFDLPREFPQQEVQTVRPFAAIDQMTIVEDSLCGQYGVGFGTFSPEDGFVPHRLQFVNFLATGYTSIDLDERNGRAVAVTNDTGSPRLVALLANDDVGGGRTLSLNSIDNCASLEVQASTPFPLPEDTGPIKNDGLVFVQSASGSVPDVISYNGALAAICTSGAASVACTVVTPKNI